MTAPTPPAIARLLNAANFVRGIESGFIGCCSGYMVRFARRESGRAVVVEWLPPADKSVSAVLTGRGMLRAYAEAIEAGGWSVKVRPHSVIVTEHPEGAPELRIAGDVLDILRASTADGTFLWLPPDLDPNLYRRTDKALRAAGGRWDGRVRAHVFPGSAPEALDVLLMTGHIVTAQDMGYFPTPEPVVARLIAAAELRQDHVVLEPSAGTGAIAEPVANLVAAVDCMDIDADRASVIIGGEYARTVWVADFLTVAPPTPLGYDRVIMNPPFARRADVAHVTHALRFVRPGGRLVAVMSAGVLFRDDKATCEFRGIVKDCGGTITALPDNSFTVAGTNVKTAFVVVDRPGDGGD